MTIVNKLSWSSASSGDLERSWGSTLIQVLCKYRFRTLKAFDMWLKKGARGTDYVFPSEMLVMMNVIVDFKNQHRYNEDEFLDRIQAEMRSSLMERVKQCTALIILLILFDQVKGQHKIIYFQKYNCMWTLA